MAAKALPARMRIRLVFDSGLVLGPGKVDLLEGIRETGSISAAGRRMKMSYKRAWDLIDAMNRHFDAPVVETAKGGNGGGGARLTAWGEEVVRRYRHLEAGAVEAASSHIGYLHRHMTPPTGG
ncbi:LysR family transcriptional regulator [Lysobacter pythonis]|uniref:LysR family transcriptional regulator n=1 Tax=Solilutibacter pythonis TaxID=2483112 RepID=A0A3M2I165_9GAMM|nr:LysR family transcriptional regulator [Lysobacter pythonis]RMH94868.1 LysR family transcriptional regulator [Lysobacter pythonis]